MIFSLSGIIEHLKNIQFILKLSEKSIFTLYIKNSITWPYLTSYSKKIIFITFWVKYSLTATLQLWRSK